MNIGQVIDEVKKSIYGENSITGLDMMVAIGRLEAALKVLKKEHVAQANAEFAKRCADMPSAKVFELPGGSVKRFTKAATYQYSEAVTTLEAQVAGLKTTINAKKAEERNSGVALKKEASVDIAKDSTFAISVYAETYPYAVKEVVEA